MFTFASLLCIVFAALAPLAASSLTGPSIWPQPKETSMGSVAVGVSPKLEFKGGNEITTLALAYDRYRSLMFPHPGVSPDASEPTVSAVTVTVDDLSETYPQLDTDESYELSVGTDGIASLSARTVYGALRGLESLSQLVAFDFDAGTYFISGCPLSVADSPRYAHRGILMDTSRHYQPIPMLERLIDSMSYAKFNGA